MQKKLEVGTYQGFGWTQFFNEDVDTFDGTEREVTYLLFCRNRQMLTKIAQREITLCGSPWAKLSDMEFEVGGEHFLCVAKCEKNEDISTARFDSYVNQLGVSFWCKINAKDLDKLDIQMMNGVSENTDEPFKHKAEELRKITENAYVCA